MAKKTRWFPGRLKPVRAGVYETYSFNPFGGPRNLGYQFFDRNKWYGWSQTIDGALRYFDEGVEAADCFQNDTWRGIAK